MSSYKVFLSKSNEAVYAIAHGFGCDMTGKVNSVKSVKCGMADDKELIPAMYHGKGYFYAAAEFETEKDKAPKYELIMC